MLFCKFSRYKAPGIDKLPGIFIKDGADLLAPPLTQLINLALSTSTFPDPFKIAKLIALFKKGYKKKNYRPISLLPLFSKMFEKVVHVQTEKFLSENNILYKNHQVLDPFTQQNHASLILVIGSLRSVIRVIRQA